jgi:hypothetical protein
VEFLPELGTMTGAGETMTRRPRSNQIPAFKAKVALAAIKVEKTLAELACQPVSVRNERYVLAAQLRTLLGRAGSRRSR